MLSVTDLRTEFGGLVAVDDVSFEIGEGELVGLIGPNGAGKTTLFDTLTGVHRPESGTVRFDGDDIVGLETHRIARSGLVRTFQTARVFEELTVLENAAIGALFGSGESLSRPDAEARARDALAFVGLAERAESGAQRLTIAQKKRLELARALATDPRLVLLDEVASGLTSSEVDALAETIRRLRDERGVSIVWIEHVVDAVMGVAERVLVLNSGAVIADDVPEAVRTNAAVVEAYLGVET